MRQITVTAHNVDQAIRSSDDGSLVVEGEDEQTGELVTFRVIDGIMAGIHMFRPDPTAGVTLGVEDADVLRVIAAPVSGEWDSPGTSPEGDE